MPLAYIRDPIALVSDLVALVGEPVPLVGRPISFLRAALSLIKMMSQLLEAGSVGRCCLRLSVTHGSDLPAPDVFELLLQRGGMRTGALSSVTNLLGDSTLHGGLVASPVLVASLRVLLGQTSAPLERVCRANQDFDGAS